MREGLKVAHHGRKREYNSVLKKLQLQADHLAQVIKQEQGSYDAAVESQLLLAEAILHHKVMYGFIVPMHGQFLQSEQDNSSAGGSSQQDVGGCKVRLQLQDTDWMHDTVQLAQKSAPVLQRVLEATPEQVQQLAIVTPQETHQRLVNMFNQTVFLQELLAPQRYPEVLVRSPGMQPVSAAVESAASPSAQQQANEDGMSAAANDGLSTPGVEEAAAELLARLRDYRDHIHDVSHVSGLWVLHNKHTLVTVANFNLATGAHEAPPPEHFLRAARRLRLTSRQIQHLRMMLSQFNRMARQQTQAGQQLVGLSENSFSLQATACGVLGSQTRSQSGDSGGSQPAGTGCAAPSGVSSHRSQEDVTDTPAAAAAAGQAQLDAEGADGATAGVAALEDLLAKHLEDRLDLMAVVSMWAQNTLTPWQVGQYLVACYPYFAITMALVELSPLLQPCDEPQLQINTSCCEAAAQAADLAAELGYSDAHAYMQRRVAALEGQLQWALQEAIGRM